VPWPEHHPSQIANTEAAPPHTRSTWPAWEERPPHRTAATGFPAGPAPHRPQPPIEPLESDPADLWPSLPDPEPDAGWEAAVLERRLARARALRAEQRGDG
jgi:hypothetical protein